MRALLLKSTFVAALSLVAYSAQANTVLPVQNLTFTDYTGTVAPKGLFSDVAPVGWIGGTGLIAIDAPGTASSNPNGTYAVAGPFPNPPPGGNFIQADGNPTFESSFNQNLTGLAIGTTYDLSFWQAAGQQVGFPGATTEQWIVALGTTGSSLYDIVDNTTGYGKYYDTDTSADIKVSTLMNTPQQGVSPWNLVAMQFTATAVDQTLSFLAWGDNGNTVNQPPTVFLAGVNSPALPEPPTLALVGLALLGLGASVWRKGRKSGSVG